MYLKTGFRILICALILINMTSCLNEDEDEYIVSNDTQLTIFALSSNIIKELNTTDFSIDQVNSIVYNKDSLTYNTDVDFNVMVSYQTGAGTSYFMTVIDGDSVWVTSGDSINIGKMKQIDIYAPTGNKKTYEFKLNVHQVDADSMQYELWVENEDILASGENNTIQWDRSYLTYTKENSQIYVYQSDDLIIWEKQILSGLQEDVILKSILATENGLYIRATSGILYHSLDGLNWDIFPIEFPVKSILGYLNPEEAFVGSQQKGLCVVLEKEQVNVFGLLPDEESENSVVIGEKIPDDFPLLNFSVIFSSTSKSVFLIEGLTTIWATDNGLYWTKFTNSNQGYPEIKGGNAFIYDEKLYYIGGTLSDGTYNQDVFTSVNSGIFWDKKETNTHAPEQYTQRENASVVLDEKGIYFYVIGGRNFTKSQSVLTDIWKIGINSKIFED